MRDAPGGFARRLREEFRGRLRVRWSTQRREWQIEQKVGRAALPTRRIDESDDRSIRARDGYALVCAVRDGDRMPCPTCGETLRVPILTFAETICPVCKKN